MTICDNTYMKNSVRNEEIATKYTNGAYAAKLAKEYGISIRQIQRICKTKGVIRTIKESFNMAVEEGRVPYYRKPEHLKVKRKTISMAQRYRTLVRDDYTCRLCGASRKDGIRLEIDHIDNDRRNNSPRNLQTLCDACNKGKSYASEEWNEYQKDRKQFYKKYRVPETPVAVDKYV